MHGERVRVVGDRGKEEVERVEVAPGPPEIPGEREPDAPVLRVRGDQPFANASEVSCISPV